MQSTITPKDSVFEYNSNGKGKPESSKSNNNEEKALFSKTTSNFAKVKNKRILIKG